MSYLPIEDYGVVGNLETVALIGKNGSIDWFCFPCFDSPSIFGGLLDYRKGGHFRIFAVDEQITNKQVYWPDTNVLLTRFLSVEGVGEVTDFMPIDSARRDGGYHGLIRRVKAVRGKMRFRIECLPA